MNNSLGNLHCHILPSLMVEVCILIIEVEAVLRFSCRLRRNVIGLHLSSSTVNNWLNLAIEITIVKVTRLDIALHTS